MDKERIYFLVSESRILAYSFSPDDDDIIEAARSAILMGDRNIKVMEFDFHIGLTESPDEDVIAMILKNEKDIIDNVELIDALSERKLEEQKEVWDTMPEGIYRLQKEERRGKEVAISIEFCPDIGDNNWEWVESVGWNKKSTNQDS